MVVFVMKPSNAVQGQFAKPYPKGIVIHSTRSGSLTNTIEQEALGTANWAMDPRNPLAWNATGGVDTVYTHMSVTQWGWHARDPISKQYLAYEFAQTHQNKYITDAQVDAFVEWVNRYVRPEYPHMVFNDTTIVAHSETPSGVIDRKTDPYPKNSVSLKDLKDRILIKLNTPDNYIVGEGVRNFATEQGLTIVSDEMYYYPGRPVSQTMTTRGYITWYKDERTGKEYIAYYRAHVV